MRLELQIIDLIRTKFGTPLSRPAEFEALAEDVFKVTHERLGVNTLKRLFGVIDGGKPTTTTLDIIARYVGYSSFKLMKNAIQNTNSSFIKPVYTVFPQDLPAGTLIELTYEPERLLLLEITEDHRCLIRRNVNTKLEVGDLLAVPSITLHSPFVVKNVEHAGHSLSAYTGGLIGGVCELRIL